MPSVLNQGAITCRLSQQVARSAFFRAPIEPALDSIEPLKYFIQAFNLTTVSQLFARLCPPDCRLRLAQATSLKAAHDRTTLSMAETKKTERPRPIAKRGPSETCGVNPSRNLIRPLASRPLRRELFGGLRLHTQGFQSVRPRRPRRAFIVADRHTKLLREGIGARIRK